MRRAMTVAEDSCAIGVDLGGTSAKGGIVTGAGKVVTRVEAATPGNGTGARICQELRRIVDDLIKQARRLGLRPEGIGVALPGFVLDGTREIVHTPNLPGLEGYPLYEDLVDAYGHLGYRVVLEMDVCAAMAAEYRFGAGRGFERLASLVIGTGVGGAVMVDGRILRFNRNCSGDVGHIVVAPDGDRCSAGGRGRLEAQIAAPAIRRRGLALVERGASTALSETKGLRARRSRKPAAWSTSPARKSYCRSMAPCAAATSPWPRRPAPTSWYLAQPSSTQAQISSRASSARRNWRAVFQFQTCATADPRRATPPRRLRSDSSTAKILCCARRNSASGVVAIKWPLIKKKDGLIIKA